MKTSPSILSAALATIALSACVQNVNIGELDGAQPDSASAPDAATSADASAPEASAPDATMVDATAMDARDASVDGGSLADASWPDAIIADVGPVMPGVETARTTLDGNLSRAAYTSDDRTMFAWLSIGGRSERDLYAIDTMSGAANRLLSGVTLDSSSGGGAPLGDRIVRYSTPRMVAGINGWVSVLFDTVTRREVVAGAPQDYDIPALVHGDALYVAVSTAAEPAEDTPFGTRYRYRRQLRRYALDTGAMTGSYDLPWGFFDSFAIWQRQGSTLYLAPAWQCPIMPGASCAARIDPAPFVRIDLATMAVSSIATLPTGASTVRGSSGAELFVTRDRAVYVRDAGTAVERALLAAPSAATESAAVELSPDGSRVILGTTVTAAGMIGRLRDLQLYFPATRAMVAVPRVLGDATASVDLAVGGELSQAVYRADGTTELWFIVRSGASAVAYVVADFDARGALVRSRGFSMAVQAPAYRSTRSSIVRSPDGLREFLLRRDMTTGFVHVLSAATGSPEGAFAPITTVAADHSALGAPANDRVTFLVRDPMRGFVQLFARGL